MGLGTLDVSLERTSFKRGANLRATATLIFWVRSPTLFLVVRNVGEAKGLAARLATCKVGIVPCSGTLASTVLD